MSQSLTVQFPLGEILDKCSGRELMGVIMQGLKSELIQSSAEYSTPTRFCKEFFHLPLSSDYNHDFYTFY